MYTTLGMLTPTAVGGGPPPEVYPTLTARRHQAATSPTISRSITLPAGITAGQRIVLVISMTAATITTPPAGYTQASGQMVYHKLASGSEGNTVVSWSISSSSAGSNHAALVFSNASQVEAAVASAATANANPPSLTVSWGANNNLFLALYHGMDTGNQLNGYPANCPLYRNADEVNIDEYMAGAESLLATFNPDAFATDATSHRIWTLGLTS